MVLKEQIKKVVIQPFGYMVRIVVTNDAQQSALKMGMEIPPEMYACHVTHRGMMASTIILPRVAPASTIAHEAFHCVWAIMETVGAEHENEVMAYMLGYIVTAIEQVVLVARKNASVPVPKKGKAKLSPKLNGDTVSLSLTYSL